MHYIYRKEPSTRPGFDRRPGTAPSHRTRGTGSMNCTPSSGKGEEDEESDANMPAMTELINYSKEYLQKLVRLTDDAQNELFEVLVCSKHV